MFKGFYRYDSAEDWSGKLVTLITILYNLLGLMRLSVSEAGGETVWERSWQRLWERGWRRDCVWEKLTERLCVREAGGVRLCERGWRWDFVREAGDETSWGRLAVRLRERLTQTVWERGAGGQYVCVARREFIYWLIWYHHLPHARMTSTLYRLG